MFILKSNIQNLVLILIFCFTNNIKASAQCKSFTISRNGDTLNCVDTGNRKQGKWILRVDELRGEPGFEEEGVFINSLKEGRWRRYNLTGDLIAIENYRWGNKDGVQKYYNMYGALLEEQSWRAVNPANAYDTVPVFSIINPGEIEDYKIVKSEGRSFKHGIWKTYDPQTRRVVKVEKYFMDKIDNGQTIAQTNDDEEVKKEIPKPKEVLEYDKKNKGKKKYKERTGSTGG